MFENNQWITLADAMMFTLTALELGNFEALMQLVRD